MSRRKKLLEKFLLNPDSLKYRQIRELLLALGCIEGSVRGSHRKFRHPNIRRAMVISVHGNDCLKVYKLSIAKIIKNKIL
ncbi:type II toxin-antitoxin system HicA family toxin [Patescibacteria group bacterium]|nr:type II toxin-antitoxin system HicA family toxin [Patescibacteria group bacterium]